MNEVNKLRENNLPVSCRFSDRQSWEMELWEHLATSQNKSGELKRLAWAALRQSQYDQHNSQVLDKLEKVLTLLLSGTYQPQTKPSLTVDDDISDNESAFLDKFC